MQELPRLADHVVLLDRGRVRVQGSIAQLFSDPVFAASVGGQAGAVLRGSMSSHDPVYHLTCIDVQGQQLWVQRRDLDIGASVRVHVHANDVSVATTRPEHTSAQNIMRGVIQAIHDDHHPATCLLRVGLGNQQLIVRITRKALAMLSLVCDQSVWLQIKSVALAERQDR